jgi:hypothetical protein
MAFFTLYLAIIHNEGNPWEERFWLDMRDVRDL